MPEGGEHLANADGGEVRREERGDAAHRAFEAEGVADQVEHDHAEGRHEPAAGALDAAVDAAPHDEGARRENGEGAARTARRRRRGELGRRGCVVSEKPCTPENQVV